MVIFPSIKTIYSEKTKLAADKVEMEKLTQKAMFLNNLDDVTMRSQTNTAVSSLPAEKSIPGLLAGLERLAAQATASIDTFSVVPGKISTQSANTASPSAILVKDSSETVLGNNVRLINVTLSMHGPYMNIRNFLDSISKANRLINVDKITLVRDDKNQTEESYTANLILNIYYQPLDTILPPITEPPLLLNEIETENLGLVSGFTGVTFTPPLVPAGKENLFN